MSSTQTYVPALPFLLPLGALGVVIGLAWLRRRRALTLPRGLTVVGAVLYGLAVLRVTLLPLFVATGVFANQVGWTSKVNLIPVLTIDLRTFVLNMVMTLPLGVLVPMLTGRWNLRRTVVTGLVVSLLIEIAQAVTNIVVSSGRTGDVNDLLANTLGAVVGWWVITWMRSLASTRDLVACFSVPDRRGADSLAPSTR